MPKHRPQRTNRRDIDTALGHIASEVETCVEAAIRCVVAAGPGGDPTARNAFLESALLHARCAFEFLDAK